MYFIISRTVINISNVTIISIITTPFSGSANRLIHPILSFLYYHKIIYISNIILQITARNIRAVLYFILCCQRNCRNV